MYRLKFIVRLKDLLTTYGSVEVHFNWIKNIGEKERKFFLCNSMKDVRTFTYNEHLTLCCGCQVLCEIVCPHRYKFQLPGQHA
jgi:hypothetical protein